MSEQNPTPPPAPEEKPKTDYSKRDSETQLALGIFVSVIAVPVILGTFWADQMSAMVVNLISGLVLLGFGVGLGIYGLTQLLRKPR